MIQAQHRAALNAGLTKFKNELDIAAAHPGRADTLFEAAVNDLTDSSANYAEQLRTRLADADQTYCWLLARHLTVSSLGEAAVNLRLGQKGLAVQSLETALVPLREHAKSVFARTVAADPARFLRPALAAHGITLEVVAELYRQAGHAGAVGPEERLSAAERFEALRGCLHTTRDPRFRVASAVRRRLAEWSEASAVVEEVNRVRGLSLTVRAYHQADRTYDDLAAEILREALARQTADGACLAFFPAQAGEETD